MTTVIVEYAIPMPGKNKRWVAAEVPYSGNKDTITYGRPEILNMIDGQMKDNYCTLLSGLLRAKGEFFNRVTRAILRDEKRRNKKKKGGA